MKDAADSSETLVTIYKTTWCPNPGGHTLNLYHHENATDHMKLAQLRMQKKFISSLCIQGIHNHTCAHTISYLYHSVKNKQKKFTPVLCQMPIL